MVADGKINYMTYGRPNMLPVVSDSLLSDTLVDPDRLAAFVAATFSDAGLSERDAARAAEVLVHTDERGQHTHGVWFLAEYVEWLGDGRINARAEPHVV